jgi:hypothetical protein
MGTTVWVLKEGQEDDNWDHSLMLSQEKELDRLAEKLKVKKLSELYDYSVLSDEFGGPETEPNYLAPEVVKETLRSLIGAIKAGNSGVRLQDELVEELEDCFIKAVQAETENCKVRLSIIP